MVEHRISSEKNGVVFTKKSIVNIMLDIIGYDANKDLSAVTILEPSAGEGAFIFEILNRLLESSKKYNFSFVDATKNIYLFEIDEKKVETLKFNIRKFVQTFEIKVNIYTKDFLLADNILVDLVVGNPPYIRWDNIPSDLKEKYKKIYSTFNNRSDIYIPFYEKALLSLKENGKLCYICSNRWFKNQYGKSLRRFISSFFHVDSIIDIEETQPFEENVIAYPAITSISNKTNNLRTKLFTTNNLDEIPTLIKENIFEEITLLPSENRWLTKIDFSNKYFKYFDSIESQNFKIGIGVATGNDKIFISENFDNKIESDLLLPIITSKELKGNEFRKSSKKIINPFRDDGGLIELDSFPKTKKYFNENKEPLLKRYIAKKNLAFWYRTIDKINIQLLQKSKILLPDISGNKFIFIDQGKYYPHHNLYYITGENLNDLKVLASILMSKLIYDQLSSIGNKMNGGYPRWQSQNLRKLRIPIIQNLKQTFKEELINAYDAMDLIKINSLINIQTISKYSEEKGQMKLFEPISKYNK